MNALLLALRYCLHHRLRTALTAGGIAIALFAFCMIRTFVDAWHSGVRASAKDRLVTRNAVSLVFYLPFSYGARIGQVPGVQNVAWANWFGGIYRDERYRFAQFAVSENYLDVYPEFLLPPEQRKAFTEDRQGVVIGEDLAQRFGLSLGQRMQVRGTLFPGLWEFTVRGIFRGRDSTSITRTMYFHWELLNERNKREIGRQPDHVGIFVVQLAPGADPAQVSREIDGLFANSFAETLTETETAFQQSFVSMSSNIILALNAISGVVIVIMLLVLTNTMLMASRERFREYSILKAIGFGPRRLFTLVVGESLTIGLLGFAILLVLLIPFFVIPGRTILGALANFFPVFEVSMGNIAWSLLAAVVVALIAAAVPVSGVMRIRVSEGLRRAG